ncbi:hypothetical protein YPPY34_1755, partial [Yersinia pestis PY-34]
MLSLLFFFIIIL